MNWLQNEQAAKWREEGQRYAGDVNQFVHKGLTEGWDKAGNEPAEDTRGTLAAKIYKMIRGANEHGEMAELRAQLPAATWPLSGHFQKEMQAIRGIHFISDDAVVFSTGTPWEKNAVVVVHKDVISVFGEFSLVGASPDNQFYALAGTQGITIMQSMNSTLQGTVVATLSWRELNGTIQALDPDFPVLDIDSLDQALPLEQVIPFNGGGALLLVMSQGIFLVQQSEEKPWEVNLLHPDLEEYKADEIEHIEIDMPHGAVSPDGRWISYGSQGSDHLLYDITSGQVHLFNPESSYPHYTIFTKDQHSVWFNACHFYNGVTLAVPLEDVVAGKLPADQEYPLVNEEARVYAAAALKEGVVIGDAYGYLRLIDAEGRELWRYYAGSTISGLAINPDETLLAVGTYGGMLHFLDLHAAQRSDYEITTGTVREVKRIIAWKNQKVPLWW
ncbi:MULTISPECIES: hypothetical protein [unclassified Paenibacillus]|uniref:WD40 repeat domain-containing protein n=1 Tax=unclassified Paenibacillus TaxID=185978 RepID=UPI0003E252E0|nr:MULTISPECIES: hypothetical protein [unclassified Paenibacillus]ETT39043.1 hypothetical protein C162_28429 [Paenibacillus sp. FSL R7-269]OMF90096.1 hypothetical protein BK147_24170 [Paenibacillus sp. FSL R7-0337]